MLLSCVGCGGATLDKLIHTNASPTTAPQTAKGTCVIQVLADGARVQTILSSYACVSSVTMLVLFDGGRM